jgi:hypothetical protein
MRIGHDRRQAGTDQRSIKGNGEVDGEINAVVKTFSSRDQLL